MGDEKRQRQMAVVEIEQHLARGVGGRLGTVVPRVVHCRGYVMERHIRCTEPLRCKTNRGVMR